ncbi:PDZ domain-containing protein [Patescibacteria group bacterium]|nr:PDZ domain-containing protein [Patescibacteria group bacterium]
MVHPGEVVITSVIKDAPAAKAGLRGNDRIIKVDDYTITEKDSLDFIISKIKGPAGTVVKLTIDRGGVRSVIPVTRAKITISMIDYKFTKNTPIITIHSFGRGVANTWSEMLKKNASAIQNAGKLIIDLRDNPGGSLQEVAEMLSDFVPRDQPVVVTLSRYQEESVVSAGRKIVDFSKIHIVILINGSTASASEIMAGTIKDYLTKNTTIIGERSYGKGSVQYLQTFDDNSSFKMTIAHWYTGKTKKIIDGVGITPDIEVFLDPIQFKQGYDNQMEKALSN